MSGESIARRVQPARRLAFWKALAVLAPFVAALFTGCAYRLIDEPGLLPFGQNGADDGMGRKAAGDQENYLVSGAVTSYPDLHGMENLPALTQKLPRILFDYNSDQLTPAARAQLGKVAQQMRKNLLVVLLVEGHCDERGTTEYNFALGQRRAEKVRDYLTKLGVERRRIHTISYGEERPLDYRSTDAAHRLNRRVQFLAYEKE